MTHHNANTNAELNSPLHQKGNETMPTIKSTPLKTNTPTISLNKVGSAFAANAIVVSVRKNLKRRKRKQREEKKIRIQWSTMRDSNWTNNYQN
jgi:hypothetical protein